MRIICPPPKHTHTHTGLSPDIVYTVFVTSETDITDQIPVEGVFNLTRGDTVVQATDGIANEITVGLSVFVVAVVIAAIAVISVVICIAVHYKKRVRRLEIELKKVQIVQPNPSDKQATQSILDGKYD